ncbi:MAG: serine hydrolase [Oscillospiraceae bacterium]|jgi:D-alanyl-D-alanine carboxypeptidase (penicillin-binding protein 5/6)|nr:serine hydrolase [Oscillospiraceae bacterium]
MVKRICAVLLGLILSLSCFAVHASGAPEMAEEAYEDAYMEVEESLEMLKLDEELPEAIAVSGIADDSLPAKSAIMLDQVQGQVLYEKNADEQLPPASITKVMTLLLAMEELESGRISLDDVVVASDYAASMGGSQIWLKPGEEMTLNDLLKAVAISSANDASVAVGEHIAGTNDAFVDMMNIRAQELGMVNTHFINCTGLDEPGHLTTARDVAIMSRELMKHKRIRDYSTVWMDSLRGGETELVNTNRLVRFYNGSTGLKTGTTNGAGSCLSATAERDGLGLVTVVMGCPTSDERFASARSLLDYGFANYTSAPVPPIDNQLTPVKVIHGVESTVGITYEPPGNFVVDKRNAEAITQEITLVPDVEAPVAEGQILGKVEIIIDGNNVASYDLKAKTECGRMTVYKAFSKLLSALCNMAGREGAAPEESGEAEETGDASEAAPENASGENASDSGGNAADTPDANSGDNAPAAPNSGENMPGSNEGGASTPENNSGSANTGENAEADEDVMIQSSVAITLRAD